MVPAWAPQWIGWFGVLCLCSIVNVSRNKGPPVTSFVLFAAMNPPQDAGKIPEQQKTSVERRLFIYW